jgi:hypothetical protein
MLSRGHLGLAIHKNFVNFAFLEEMDEEAVNC